jgi:hypothetical protein
MLHYKLLHLNTFFAAAFALCVALAGCSVIDSPPSTPSPELDVRNYYLQLTTTNTEYHYAVTAANPSYPKSDTLSMNMQGQNDSINNTPLYSCLWTYNNWGTPTLWHYGLTDKQAINYGIETSPDNYSDSWVDLQSPLKDSASWTFTSWGETITAIVVKYGASAEVNGKTYSDVVMVQYTGSNGGKGTTGTEWFARGTGIIYSHINRENLGVVENQLQSVTQ